MLIALASPEKANDPDVRALVEVEHARLTAAVAARALLAALGRPSSRDELLAVAHQAMLTAGDLWDALGRTSPP